MGSVAFEWVLHVFYSTGQGTAVALILIAVARLHPRSTPAFRGALLSAALLKFLLPPMLPAATGVFSSFDATSPQFFRRDPFPASGAGWVWIALASVHAAGMAAAALGLSGEALSLARLRRRAIPVTSPEILRHRRLLCARLGLQPEPAVLASREIAVPCAFGIRKPVVVFPAAFLESAGEEELRQVLAHELAHLSRRDPRRNALAVSLSVLWWFNPVSTALCRELRQVWEESADDEALRALCDSAKSYSEALVAAAAFASRSPVRSGSFGSSGESAASLCRRISRLADPVRRRSTALSLPQRLALAAAVLFLLPGIRPGSERSPSPAVRAISRPAR